MISSPLINKYFCPGCKPKIGSKKRGDPMAGPPLPVQEKSRTGYDVAKNP
jgi:hypothetical protein